MSAVGLALPVVFDASEEIPNVIDRLEKAYFETYNEYPKIELIQSWKSSMEALKKAGTDYPIIAELPVFTSERIDYIVVGKTKALVIESKGWSRVRKLDEFLIDTEYGETRDPCYQLANYISKLRYFHTASSRLTFTGVVYTYHTGSYRDSCTIITETEQLRQHILDIGEPGSEEEISAIVNGKFQLSKDLIEIIKSKKGELLRKASFALLSAGLGLTEEQSLVVSKVLSALRNNENRVFLIRGESGSGKTLVAITLLIEAICKGYKALLGYKNNRLLNTLRKVMRVKIKEDLDLSILLQFFSTGPRKLGIGEPLFTVDKFGHIDLVIYDEAQRMTEEVVKLSMQRARILVYFYDDRQILIGDESGTRETFLRYATNPIEMELGRTVRLPSEYLGFVRSLLYDRGYQKAFDYDFRVFTQITDLIAELRNKKDSFKVAIIAAFTESEGDEKKRESIRNLRIGFPLQSGFDLYKNTGLRIRWLMKAETEYPNYWMGKVEDPLQYCASVYGAQGFEADYVGLIWGRDMIRRSSGWEVNPDVITDDVGNAYSLKKIARINKARALELLRNRYYIMLTRGIRGTYVFFEDDQTRQYIESLTQRGNNKRVST